MTRILLINPNTSLTTTAMLIDVARSVAPLGVEIAGATAAHGVSMIVTAADLRAAAPEVVRLGMAEAFTASAIIVAAFGDPGIAMLRQSVSIPVIGIGEASVREAALNQRAFGIATTTPGLMAAIRDLVAAMPEGKYFTGVRVPPGDPIGLAADPAAQQKALAEAVRDCIALDGARAVIIGGGPLSAAAQSLRRQFGDGIVEPVPAAIRAALRLIAS